MKRSISVTALILCVLLLLPTLTSCGVPDALADLFNRQPEAERPVLVSVMLALGEGVTVLGDNPMRVAPGTDAVFQLRVDDGIRLDLPERNDIDYSDGCLTVLNVQKPMTVDLPSHHAERLHFAFSENISSSHKPGDYLEGEKIRLFADEKLGERVFIGFSNGNTLENGGELLANDASSEIVLARDTMVYANYASEGSMILVYHANGGRTSGGSDALYIEIKNSVYICPNTLADQGQLVRDGYVLGGYNTAPDGSGRYYGCGWNVVMPESNVAELYAVWIKETDPAQFEIKSTAKTVTINKYNGNDETVVIPEKINGVPVTALSAGAFAGSKMKTLYITRNVTKVPSGTVKDCPDFTTLYLYDSVTSIADASFSNCPNFSKIYLQAVMDPRYINGRNGTYQMKYERLMTAPSPKLVLHAGSNVAYGIDSALLEEETGHRYNVVNYGCNQSTPACFYIEVIAAWAQPGDILIHAPEGGTSNAKYQYGYNEMNTTTWQIFEGAFDAFSCIDLRHLIKFFDSFASFQSARLGKGAVTYEHYTSETVNQYGDYIKLKKGQSYLPSLNSKNFSPSIYTADYVANLNRSYDLCRENGMKVWFSFGAINTVTIKPASATDEVLEKYMNDMKGVVRYDAMISDIRTYIMDSKYFYNSDYHLNTEGSQIRTRNLAKDILGQLAREGKTK